MKKSIIFILILILALIPTFSVSVSAEYYNMNLEDMRSEAYLLVNIDTGATVFSQNADKQLKCASLVKTATALVVVENCDDLDAMVTVTESAISPLEGLYSSSADLKAGEQISVRNLLYCMMLENANDAANVLAEYIGGTIENFVKMMNDTAKELGCNNTNFTNAHGLDEEGEYTTANDMYILTKKAIEYSVLSDMAEIVDYTVPATNMSEPRELNNWFDMIENGTRYYYSYAKGFKCGMTDEAKRCASVVGTKDAYSYIGIILGCPSECIDGCGYPDNTDLYEARRMLRWAFANLKMTTVAEPTDVMTTIPVTLSADADHVRLVPEKQIQALLLSSVDESSLEFIYETEENVMAPIEKGQVLGNVKIKYADSVIADVNLVAGDSISRSGMMFMGHIVKTVFLSPVFLIIATIVILGVLIYMAIIYNNYKKKQKATRKRLRDIKEQNYASSADLSEINK
ncbi:MAG: D-alanyl-D-alanine carboxypeptidase [Clostridia bacterium]|nr:D-alanyl-D-alanine carboxypeptidase [Clostridia bacterium]